MRRAARNPRIARVMGQLRYGQDVGEGLRRMAEVMESNRRPPPEIRQTAGGVKITLRAPAPELRRLAELPAANPASVMTRSSLRRQPGRRRGLDGVRLRR